MAVIVTLPGTTETKTFHEKDAEVVKSFESVAHRSHADANEVGKIPVECNGAGGTWITKDIYPSSDDLWFAALARKGFVSVSLFVAHVRIG